jgi:hypothetical protein
VVQVAFLMAMVLLERLQLVYILQLHTQQMLVQVEVKPVVETVGLLLMEI